MVFNNYGWNNVTPASLPMNPSNEFIQALDSSEPLERNHRARIDSTCFRYHAAIAKLIWPMITTRPELSYPVVKLRQCSINPATIHYDAVYGSFQYLSGTRNDGLTYTFRTSLTWVPVVKKPIRSQPMDRIDEHVQKEDLQTLYGYSDDDWDMDIKHRCSISNMVFFLAGAVVAWKTSFQSTVALSTAEAEFLAASDSGCLGIFIRAVLDELCQHQCEAMNVYEDNDACKLVVGDLH
jgi:hypothetical protein